MILLLTRTAESNSKINIYDLTEALAKIEVALDYPEHDEELITTKEAQDVLVGIGNKLEQLIENSSSGQKLKSGVNIAICGSPNVGKSSLLNALLGRERAIVSSVAGTTRDTISETIVHGGIKFNLTDTAGIRNEGDEIEKIGIERAKNEIENSDLTLFVVDLTRKMTEEEKALLKKLNKEKTIVVLNKRDIAAEKQLSFCLSRSQQYFVIKNHGFHAFFYNLGRKILIKRGNYLPVFYAGMDMAG